MQINIIYHSYLPRCYCIFMQSTGGWQTRCMKMKYKSKQVHAVPTNFTQSHGFFSITQEDTYIFEPINVNYMPSTTVFQYCEELLLNIVPTTKFTIRSIAHSFLQQEKGQRKEKTNVTDLSYINVIKTQTFFYCDPV